MGSKKLLSWMDAIVNVAIAKLVIAQLVEDIGLHPIDVGPLMRARQLEAMELLHMAIQSTSAQRFKSAIKTVS